ncbi:MAG TPA: hypothetical protein VG265_14115 [Gaiellaceae bacterium]|nr:hypothetical protein [Gaiellaceae bacterium]
MRRLLILGCSQTKTKSPFRVATHRRYDGPIWKTFRAVREEGFAGAIDVEVLSAEHGLIPLHHAIHDYDRRMTPERAAELRSGAAAQGSTGFKALCLAVSWKLEAYVLAQAWGHVPPYDDALIVAGGTYVEALDLGLFDRAGVPVSVAAGGIGEKRAAMRRWMKGEG